MTQRHEHKSTLGSRQRMLTNGVAPNLTLAETQLIRASVERPRQFMVTVAPPTKGNGILPYVSTFDGGAYPPVGGAIYTAPPLPDALGALQVFVRWGAAGVSFETAFDYPVLGGVFGITCDTLDVNVRLKAPQVIPLADANEVPNVGAFMVEGLPADPTPMGWLEAVASLAPGSDAFYAVKPFARELRVRTSGTTRMTVEWLNTQGATLASSERVATAPDDLYFVEAVPRQATVVRIVNTTGSNPSAFYLEWGIGLS